VKADDSTVRDIFAGEIRHIIPVFQRRYAWEQERWESELKTYNPRTGKFYAGEPVVKDVCANCNNVCLSQLDQYLTDTYGNLEKLGQG
jgi:hypothetical protein